MADHKVPPSLVLAVTPSDSGRGLLAWLLGIEAMERTGLGARKPSGVYSERGTLLSDRGFVGTRGMKVRRGASGLC